MRRRWLAVVRARGETGYTWHESKRAAWEHAETLLDCPGRWTSRGSLSDLGSSSGVGETRYTVMVWRPEPGETCDECGRAYAEAPAVASAVVAQLRAELRGVSGVNVLIGQKSRGLQDKVTELEAELQSALATLTSIRTQVTWHDATATRTGPAIPAEPDEALLVAIALYGAGIDPDGNYAGTPGSRARQLLNLETKVKAWRTTSGHELVQAVLDLSQAIDAITATTEG